MNTEPLVPPMLAMDEYQTPVTSHLWLENLIVSYCIQTKFNLYSYFYAGLHMYRPWDLYHKLLCPTKEANVMDRKLN